MYGGALAFRAGNFDLPAMCFDNVPAAEEIPVARSYAAVPFAEGWFEDVTEEVRRYPAALVPNLYVHLWS